MRGRYVTQDPKKDNKGDVLMDENFLECAFKPLLALIHEKYFIFSVCSMLVVYSNPVYVWPHAKAVLMQAIMADTEFLAKNSIMDYSLLTGLDEQNGELVVGIIGT